MYIHDKITVWTPLINIMHASVLEPFLLTTFTHSTLVIGKGRQDKFKVSMICVALSVRIIGLHAKLLVFVWEFNTLVLIYS